MAVFAYLAETQGGEVSRGRVEAEDRRAALAALGRERLRALSLREVRRGRAARAAATGSGARGARGGRMAARRELVFAQKLATLLGSGVTLPDALGLMAGGARGEAAAGALAEVRAGLSFCEALARLPAPPSEQTLALVAVGEATGTLGDQLARAASDIDRREALRRAILGQLAYPAALAVLMVLTIAFLAHLVLPQFEDIFSGTGASPPPETVVVLAAGRWVRDWGTLVLVLGLAGLLLIRVLRRRYRDAADRLTLRLPLMGGLVLEAEAARFCRALGALLVGGCQLAAALPIARGALRLPVLRARFEAASREVRAGLPLSVAFGRVGLLGEEAVQLIRIGERTGRLGEMALQAASAGEARVAGTLKRLSALTGPVMTALMGLMTAAVIGSVMTGVLSLNDAIQ